MYVRLGGEGPVGIGGMRKSRVQNVVHVRHAKNLGFPFACLACLGMNIKLSEPTQTVGLSTLLQIDMELNKPWFVEETPIGGPPFWLPC